ncbi:MAG: DUF5335 family protein [Cytophagales bacterium]|nr:DUF5335 family protein [Armatimonadota bacterium]
MATHEIPQSDWEKYLSDFSERHRGALVTIEDVDPMSSPVIETRDLPFVSIGYDADGADGAGIIELVLGATGGGHGKTHAIPAPKAVFHKPGAGVLSSEVNPDEVLEVTSGAKPPIHYLTFRHS